MRDVVKSRILVVFSFHSSSLCYGFFTSTGRKPSAWLNVAPGATHAPSLKRKVVGTVTQTLCWAPCMAIDRVIYAAPSEEFSSVREG